MKSTLNFFGILLMSIVLLTSCGKDDDPETTPINNGLGLEKTELTLQKGRTTSVKITKGSGEYQSEVNNDKVSVYINDNIINIKAIKVGNAKITITDTQNNKTASIMVTVESGDGQEADLKLDKTEVSLTEGQTTKIEILSGSGDYNLSKEDYNNVISESIEGNTISITGLKEGSTKLNVIDNTTNQIVSINISVEKGDFYMMLNTGKEIGEEILLSIEKSESEVWVDINNNNQKDDGETVTAIGSGEYFKFPIESKNFKIHGKVVNLTCSYNELTSLEVSDNIYLEDLSCFTNQINSLDVSKNVKLKSLHIAENNITDIDIANNTKLEYFNCSKNDFKGILDLSNNPKLYELECNDNNLTTINLSNNVELKQIHCSNNKISNLDVSNLIVLRILNAENNELSSLDASTNSKLSTLRCHTNKLTVLELPKGENDQLDLLECYGNLLTNLDVSNFSELETFKCQNNPNLTCIKVNEQQLNLPPYYAWEKDDAANYNTNCN